MSEQHTPGKGMHQEDLNALTGYWHRETNHINDIVDSSFKSAQDDAYARGYRRGRDDLIIIRKQRDELLAALESILPEFRQHSLRNLRDDETSENHRCRVFDHDDHLYEIANKVIASVKANTQ